jgi:hypothetical protein
MAQSSFLQRPVDVFVVVNVSFLCNVDIDTITYCSSALFSVFCYSVTSKMDFLLKSWTYCLRDSLSSIWSFFQKNGLRVKERVLVGIHKLVLSYQNFY